MEVDLIFEERRPRNQNQSIFTGILIAGKKEFSLEESQALIEGQLRFIVRKLSLSNFRPKGGLRAIYLFQEGRLLSDGKIDDREFNYKPENEMKLHGKFIAKDMVTEMRRFEMRDMPVLSRLHKIAKVCGLNVTQGQLPTDVLRNSDFRKMKILESQNCIVEEDLLMLQSETISFRMVYWENYDFYAGINKILKQWYTGERPHLKSIRLSIIGISPVNHFRILQDLPYTHVWDQFMHEKTPLKSVNLQEIRSFPPHSTRIYCIRRNNDKLYVKLTSNLFEAKEVSDENEELLKELL